MKLLEEKIQENFLWPRDKQRFLRIQKARYIKRKRVIIRGISSKYKRCFKQNEKPQIGKRDLWHISDRELESRIYRAFSKPNNKKTNNSVLK